MLVQSLQLLLLDELLEGVHGVLCAGGLSAREQRQRRNEEKGREGRRRKGDSAGLAKGLNGVNADSRSMQGDLAERSKAPV